FNDKAKPELMLRLNADIDALAFGQPGTALDGLLFVSHDRGTGQGTATELTMVDLATLHTLAVATGGTRGDVVRTTSDGRVLLSQSHQIDVLNPVQAPLVISTNPPPDGIAALPMGSLSITFDHEMLTDPADPHSVFNRENYHLAGDAAGNIPIRAVAY